VRPEPVLRVPELLALVRQEPEQRPVALPGQPVRSLLPAEWPEQQEPPVSSWCWFRLQAPLPEPGRNAASRMRPMQ
jgi:hypothetical protein